jgi:hypothetical protein
MELSRARWLQAEGLFVMFVSLTRRSLVVDSLKIRESRYGRTVRSPRVSVFLAVPLKDFVTPYVISESKRELADAIGEGEMGDFASGATA